MPTTVDNDFTVFTGLLARAGIEYDAVKPPQNVMTQHWSAILIKIPRAANGSAEATLLAYFRPDNKLASLCLSP